ncbi:hypothetical protein MHD_04090 [Mannheimia granulomatis]|uniref:Uncharacterized protein n=1 Tax=Mannheimia granulomatis TaxID=85402 RepID=A0A011P525_9PAST|nr:hypothetical protein AK33_10145 [Mannheimia granulomatis]RGE48316.1 hypothetical protein MHD_04090 [Mannheimia granulomatis]
MVFVKHFSSKNVKKITKINALANVWPINIGDFPRFNGFSLEK